MAEKSTQHRDTARLETSFVPPVLKKILSEQSSWDSHGLETDHAAILWIDIYSFSPLCNRLMTEPVTGVERITSILKSHYDFLLESVTAFGGQPLFFVGDGLMSAWLCTDDTASNAVSKAAACARHIIDHRETRDDLGNLLSIHTNIAYGPWQMAEIAGVHDKKLLSFYGSVFDELSKASKNRRPDHILITNNALAKLKSSPDHDTMEHETSLLLEVPDPGEIKELEEIELSDKTIHTIKAFAPRTISFPMSRERLQWVSEIRPVTVVFVRLPNVGQSAAENLNRLQDFGRISTPLVHKYDGLLNQIWMDEKESNIFICFGPSLSAHIDNPRRAVSLALELHQTLKEAGYVNGIGISTGMAYCGILGNDILRQYTVIGDAVNLSARLGSIKVDGVYCEANTFNATHRAVEYSEPEYKTVKGRKEPIPLYTPTRMIEKANLGTVTESVGRDFELDFFESALTRVSKGISTLISVEGESGIGKSRLLDDFAQRAKQKEAVEVFKSSGDYILRHTPYSTWSSIFMDLLNLGDLDVAIDAETMLSRLDNRYKDKAALLNIVLQTDFPVNEEIMNMTASQRAAATKQLLIDILKDRAVTSTLVLLIDDAEWMDPNGWDLVSAIISEVDHCLIGVSIDDEINDSQSEAVSKNASARLKLKELSTTDSGSLIKSTLNVTEVSENILNLIHEVAKGNPFFCIELLNALSDQELLVIEEGVCHLKSGAMIDRSEMPETVRGALRRRIDRLDPGSQLSLKVGSVVGMKFAQRIVRNIYPIRDEQEVVPSYLKTAQKSGFINDSMVDNLEGFQFNSATTAEVAYEMTLAEQRRLLHHESARWYEENFPENLHPFFVRLSHHWKEAGNIEAAVKYHELEAYRLFQLGFVKEALNSGLEGVELLGYHLARTPEEIGPKIQEHMGVIAHFMQGKNIEDLIDHKSLENPKTEKLIQLMLGLTPFAHQNGQAELFALMAISCLRLTLEEGNGLAAAEVYSMYAIIYKAFTGDSPTSLAWSNLARKLDEKNGHTRQARVNFIHCWFIALWLKPMNELIPIAHEGIVAGFDSGDLIFGCFNLSLEVVLFARSGAPLPEVVELASKNFIQNNRMVINASFHLIHEEQMAKAFMGKTDSLTSLTDVKYNEEKDVASICETELYNQIGYYFISKLILHAHVGEWETALNWGNQSWPLLPAYANQPGHIDLEFYYALVCYYCANQMQDEDGNAVLAKGREGKDRIQAYSQLCPSTFLHKYQLLNALDEAYFHGNKNADQLFIEAADNARIHGFIHECGLAYEQLVRYQLSNKKDTEAAKVASIEAYSTWGADAKVKYIEAM